MDAKHSYKCDLKIKIDITPFLPPSSLLWVLHTYGTIFLDLPPVLQFGNKVRRRNWSCGMFCLIIYIYKS